jgi:hypothetical protein
MKQCGVLRSTLVAGLFALSIHSVASAAVLYSTSFENFALGNVASAVGWGSLGTASTHQVVTSPQMLGAETVTAATGSQFVRGSSVVFNNHFVGRDDVPALWAGRPLGDAALLASLKVYRPSAVTGTSAARHGLFVYDQDGNVAAAIYYRPSDGRVTFRRPTSQGGEISGTEIVPPSDWTELAVAIDFSAKTSSFLVDGVTVFSSVINTGSTSPGFVDIYTAITENPGSSTFFADDYSIQSLSVIPEPTGLLMSAAGGLLLCRRRRK